MEVTRALPGPASFPVRALTLFRLSASFVWPTSLRRPPESPVPCWHTVATKNPLGNCDSHRPETSQRYLIRLGAASYRPSPPSSSFAFDGVRTPPEELVNTASAIRTLRSALERDRANQPDPIFPQSPGIILETSCNFLSSATDHLRSFNELRTAYQRSPLRK